MSEDQSKDAVGTPSVAVNYPNFTGYNQDMPMVVYGQVQKAVHGTDRNRKPISLLVFRWHLQQRAQNRRYTSASIRVDFTALSAKDGQRNPFYDPHVRAVAPNGTYGMALTPNTITRTLALNESLVVGNNDNNNTVGANYTMMSQVKATEQVVINGNPRCLYGANELASIRGQDNCRGAPWIRCQDRCNAAEWNLFENSSIKGGLPSMFHTVVLLERHSDDSDDSYNRIQATFTIRTSINAWTDAKTRLRKLCGRIPPSIPVIFNITDWPEESTVDHDWVNKLDNADLFQLCKFYLFHTVPATKEDPKNKTPDDPSNSDSGGEKTT